jgi:E1A/CREB-binding protein
MYSKRRNDRKKIKRKEEKVKLKKKEVKHLQRNLDKRESDVQRMKRNVDRLRHRTAYWKVKCDSSGDEVAAVIIEEQEKRNQLSDELLQLEEEHLNLKDVVDELMTTNEEIATFQGGKYIDNIRSCCYELLSLNVGVRNIKPVIESVIHNIAQRSIGRLPSKTTLCDMMIECLTIAQAQLGEVLTPDDKDYFTLHTDGTTKYGEKFGTYDVTTDDKTYHLGLRHIFSGSAQTTLDTFHEILEDLDAVSEKVRSNKVSEKILCKLKNTMSDRHAAEKLFSQLLADYRENILPNVVSGWDEMTHSQKTQLIRMNNFYCSLHYLVGIADSAEATLKIWESTIDEDASHGSSSGTQRLVRTACKAFHSRGSEQAGCSVSFRTYLHSQGIHKVPLASFKGNRFNIFFYDSAGVYFLRSHIEEYLAEHHSGPLNRLLQAVLSDIRTPQHVAGCKALGIIDKLVTGPFWRKLESSTVSIIEMSDVYSKMKVKFDQWGKDALGVLEGEELLFPEFTNCDDEVAQDLQKPSDMDDMVQEVLELLFKSFSLTTQRLVIDHLPGGEFHTIKDPAIAEEIKCVPTTNVAPERDFAVLDRLLSEKPNATYIALESLLLFSQNKTSDWLLSKTEQEKERLFSAARSLTSVHKANFRKRREEMKKKRLEVQEERVREKQRKRENELKEKEALTRKIAPMGLWTTTVEVERGLKVFRKKKEKQEALKLQINFRRKVLGQAHADKSVFFFSHNRKPLSECDLKQNLYQLLPHDGVQQFVTAEEIILDPELLIYRRIEHQFDNDGKLEWFEGTVLGYNKDTKEYRIQYDGEDDIYSFPLLEDVQRNELHVFR